MGTISGTVTKAVKLDGVVETAHGFFSKVELVISNQYEEVKVQKLVQLGTDGQKLVGKNVQVTYTTKFDKNSTDSKGFVVLDASGAAVSYTKGAPKGASSAKTAPNTPNTSYKTSYDPNGARTGMIAKAAVDLAIARKGTTLNDLEAAAEDVVYLVKKLESNFKHESKEQDQKDSKNLKKEMKNTAKVCTSADINEASSPFSDD